MACKKFLALIFIVVFIFFVQSKPVEEPQSTGLVEDEMMEVAEGQHPFPPKFAMLKIKARREKARAQRRNQQSARRIDPPRRPSRPRPDCPQVRRRYYKK